MKLLFYYVDFLFVISNHGAQNDQKSHKKQILIKQKCLALEIDLKNKTSELKSYRKLARKRRRRFYLMH